MSVEAMPFDLRLTRSFSDGWYSGRALAEAVTWKWDVAVDGLPFMIDMQYAPAGFTDRTTPLLRTQSDNSEEPGESSVNPNALWPRSRSTWHLGAGQTALDRFDSAKRGRFKSSKGLDVWTENQVSLHWDTDEKQTSAAANLKWQPAGTRLYLVDGAAVTHTSDGTVDSPTFTACTGESGNTILDVTSDGFTIWTVDGASVHSSNTGTNAFSSASTQDIDVIEYVKGRLMGAHDNAIYDGSPAGSTWTAVFTHGNTAFVWVGFAEGNTAIYAAGQAGDKAIVYRIPIKPDGSALDLPVVAGTLPDGETLTGIGGYLGFIFLGTTVGVRMCDVDTQGNLILGAPFGPVNARAFEGQGRFMWFGWSNYDATSTGLGRCDLSVFADLDKRIPAYATDLMVTGQGNVLDVVTFGDRRYLTVSGDGAYGQTATLVASGTLDSGPMDYGVAHAKIALKESETYGPDFAGTVVTSLAIDGGSEFTELGTTTEAGSVSATYPVETRARKFELRHALTRGSTTTGPTLTGWTLHAQAAPEHLTPMRTIPLLIFERLITEGIEEYIENCGATVRHLKSLNASRDVVALQEANESIPVVIEDYEWRKEKRCTNPDHGWQGTLIIVAKEVV